MKKLHRIIIVVVVLLALVLAYSLVRFLPKSDGSADTATTTDTERIPLTGIEKDKISRMVLEQGRSKVEFTRNGETWSTAYPHPVELDTTSIDSLASAFSDVAADRKIADNPEDRAQFGLSVPRVRASVSTTDGKTGVLFLGDRLPSGNGYYMMKEGDTAVYTVSAYYGSSFEKTFSDFRVKTIGRALETETIRRIYLSGPKGRMEIVPAAEGDVMYEELSGFKLIRPYRKPHAVDSEAMSALAQSIQSFSVDEFIDDAPVNLSKYGLDRPYAELVAEDEKGTAVHLYIGAQTDGESRFARVEGEKRVITIDSYQLGFIESTTPFKLVGKFALLVNIKDIDSAEIKTADLTTTVSVKRTPAAEEGAEPVETFSVNGKEIEDKAFREFYQKIIGFLADAENPKPVPGKADLTVSYGLSNGKSIAVSFMPFNRDFYQVYREGVSEFLVSRDQVNAFMAYWKSFLEKNGL